MGETETDHAGGAVRVERHGGADAFLAAAGAWLARDEAAHNLIYGVVGQIRAGTYSGPVYLATLHAADRVLGCALRTPPFPLLVPELPPAATAALAADVARDAADLAGVFGAAGTAEAVARHLAPGAAPRVVHRMRNWTLDRVTAPRGVPGGARRAAAGDRELLTSWLLAFHREAGTPDHDAERLLHERLTAGHVHCWEDGGVVTMAVGAGATPHGMRIGYVYTPPAHREHGYATALTAAVSQHYLDVGCRTTFLFTDLANPTSNSIYRKVGYRPAGDFLHLAW